MLLLLLVLCNMGGEDDARTLHAVLGTTLLMRAGAPTPTHMTRLVPRLTVKSAKTERAHTHTRATCTGTRNCPHGTDMHGRARAFLHADQGRKRSSPRSRPARRPPMLDLAAAAGCGGGGGCSQSESCSTRQKSASLGK